MEPAPEQYFEARFQFDPGRERVWKAIVENLQGRFFPNPGCVVDLGCGYGDFIRHVQAAQRIAVDLADVSRHLGDGIEFLHRSALDLSPIPAGSADVAFASNFLEHLPRDQVPQALDEILRILRPGGQVLLLQPNFRLCYRRYFDDYTHQSIWTDESLAGILAASGFEVIFRKAGYLPFSMKSLLPSSYWLTRLFLRLGSPLLGKQMLLVARKKSDV